MSFSTELRKAYQQELSQIREAGIFKEERIIQAPQDSEIDVVFPAGSTEKHVINLCSNNYLGLSSHPDVVKAAHQGLDHRGYGMSSVRFICGTQDIHKELEN
ncbi:MAG: aminotransferase class I/II-fold pyridoxal phosphate-dependent enzyme, partial [Calditrichia bacterium]|nr:aminotransferase class I/II-fold pyridoxal phosphate-dependent enzyme [Calditrichia bacterium]